MNADQTNIKLRFFPYEEKWFNQTNTIVKQVVWWKYQVPRIYANSNS